MSVPTYDQFIEPVLRFLADRPEGAIAREVHEAAADSLSLSEMDRLEVLPSGVQSVYKNRAGWAHDRLKRAGLSSSPRRGFWQLTSDGLAFAQAHPSPLSANDINGLARAHRNSRLSNPSADEIAEEEVDEIPELIAVTSPDDRLESAVAELRRKVSSEILEALRSVSPGFFETIVLDLLHRMGYGASRSDLQSVGGGGDGGIDGIVSLDKLGLEKVYVQAKRWQSSVGRPEVQGFYGALAGQRARKGVFMTTSSFTTQAIDFAKSVEGIVLVDGARLAHLMIDHEVGVTLRPVRVPRFDSDYFDGESG